MNILIVNLILSTAEKGVITKRRSNYDCMIYNFARGFVANGHSVTVCASEEYMPKEKDKNDFDVVYFKSKWPRIFKPDLIPFPIGLRAYVKKNIHKYDLVIASEVFQMATLLVADVCKDKLVIWQELSLHNKMLCKLPSKFWYNYVVSLSSIKDALVVPRSENAKQFIRGYMQNVSDDIVEHGANGDILKPSNKSTHTFVIIGQLIKRKNVDKILSDFAKFVKHSQYEDYVLHIVGDGPEKKNLEKLIVSLNIAKNVVMHGFLSHKEFSSISASAKGFLVNTSKDLNMVSIPESILCGTPVLMNTLPNTAQFIANNKLGIAKDNWDEGDLVEMVENYDLYHDNCVQIREQLTNVGCSKKMIKIYTEYKQKKDEQKSSCCK